MLDVPLAVILRAQKGETDRAVALKAEDHPLVAAHKRVVAERAERESRRAAEIEAARQRALKEAAIKALRDEKKKEAQLRVWDHRPSREPTQSDADLWAKSSLKKASEQNTFAAGYFNLDSDGDYIDEMVYSP